MKTDVRAAVLEDVPYLSAWLNDPSVLRWFPMANAREVEDSVHIWTGYIRLKSALTLCLDGKPVGMANLYISPFQKLKHQSLFSIMIDKDHRGQGLGTILLENLIRFAKEEHNIEVLHLEVYDGNPAIGLYKKMGFKEYGRHPLFIKLEDGYVDKVLMQRELHTQHS